MPSPDIDVAHIDKKIAEAIQRMDRQHEVIDGLRKHGHDTVAAERLLKAMVRTLDSLQVSRRQLTRRLG
jgi:hypothetical protein